jgi:lipoate-protein ligase A
LHCVSSGARHGAWNMAMDMYLVELVSEGGFGLVLRTYGWSPPCVSIGRFQDPLREVDPAMLRSEGIGIVRRPTGGRAVLHRSEVTYSVVAPEGHPMVSGPIEESLRKVASPLVDAIRSLGIDARVNRADRHLAGRGRSSNPCFTSHGRSEITTGDGRKLVGSAQARGRGVFLEHGSILLDNDQPVMASLLPPSVDEGRRSALRESLSMCTGSLRESLPDLGPEDVERALADAFARASGEEMVFIDPGELATDRFRELEIQCARIGHELGIG